MQIYQGISIRDRSGRGGMLEEWEIGTLINPSPADIQKLINELRDDFNHLTEREKLYSGVELRLYNISDEINIADKDEITNAIIDSDGYDIMFQI